ncbi:Modulator of FtsH protease HflK [Vibrio stylophorae]|uniref:Protein HflK n=1 Tax=Vibrio stylophorae TaxID=659351 RepID=A0ABM8ZWA1_9VIBR|nr:FtsH protease activity modulator HflK [Vibrio stylophorae]CAH0534611.1 Modulator of FtsH protease HflK [Vibrio stylophorae]
MAWNEPGNNNNDPGKDPWKNNRGGRDQGPPDLDEFFSNLSRKFGGLFGGGNKRGGRQSGGAGMGGIAALFGVALVVWGLFGFYTVGEAERGVVTRFGAYKETVMPGLNWRPLWIDDVTKVNISEIRSLHVGPANQQRVRPSELMLTKDENVVVIGMTVQYKVVTPRDYLYNVTNADDSLRQATDSALRAVIGDNTMDDIITKERQKIRDNTLITINDIIKPYNMGLEIIDVSFEAARPPAEVQEAFDDAIKAREDEQQVQDLAKAYRNKVVPEAEGTAERVRREADAYAERIVNGAQGDVQRFVKLLPEYRQAPEVTRERLYLETMERIYARTSKVLIDAKASGNLLYMPLDQMMKQEQHTAVKPQHGVLPKPTPSVHHTSPAPVTQVQQSTSTQPRRY